MEGERHIYIAYIFYVCFGVPKKTLCCLMNRLNLLKHVQHFDASNSNQKKEKEKRKYPCCNILTPFELLRGNCMDIEYDYN